MQSNFDITIGCLIIFMATWYVQMTITYGTNVPAGLFLPGMIVGSALGEILAKVLHETSSETEVEY
jgi:H+/Cl- antiporter ClcA